MKYVSFRKGCVICHLLRRDRICDSLWCEHIQMRMCWEKKLNQDEDFMNCEVACKAEPLVILSFPAKWLPACRDGISLSHPILAEESQERGVCLTKGRKEEEKEKKKEGAEEKGKRNANNAECSRPKDKKPDNKVKYHDYFFRLFIQHWKFSNFA